MIIFTKHNLLTGEKKELFGIEALKNDMREPHGFCLTIKDIITLIDKEMPIAYSHIEYYN